MIWPSSSLSASFSWVTVPAAAPATAGEEVFRPAVGLLRRQGALGYSHLEIVRFAAANRLCVDLTYQGTVRRVEPYSLRRTRAGDILLFAVRAADGESRSYRLDRIQGAQVTSQSFAPRYAIELAPTELGAVPPPARGGRPRRLGPVAPRLGGAGPVTRPAVRPKAGTTYIYECSFCRKRFRRSKPGGHLGPHKTPGGWPCPGRVGHLISTQH